jgi:hypothetical protein
VSGTGCCLAGTRASQDGGWAAGAGTGTVSGRAATSPPKEGRGGPRIAASSSDYIADRAPGAIGRAAKEQIAARVGVRLQQRITFVSGRVQAADCPVSPLQTAFLPRPTCMATSTTPTTANLTHRTRCKSALPTNHLPRTAAMASSKGSFAQRMASMASTTSTIENWDDDGDFQGDLFPNSMSTVPSLSSRVSVRSESNTGDDDWQVLITPNDKLSTLNAISSAKQAGIPIPTSVPSSALLGGSIKRLGKKKSSRKIAVDDDWGNDLELPTDAGAGLKLKAPMPRTPAEDQDDFDDWGEGSLGIRFAGTRRDNRGGRSSSVSAMSPSMGSCMTIESEDDDLMGLVLPTEPLDFNARLEKLKKIEHGTPDVSPLPAQQRREPAPTSAPALAPAPTFDLTPSPATSAKSTPPLDSVPTPESKPKPAEDEEDFLDGLDFGGAEEALDTKKLTLNRNVVVKKQPPKAAAPPAARPATTLTFTDKPSASRIPRPLPASNRTRLTPV